MASSSSLIFKALAPRAYALSARAPLFRLSALTRSSHVVALPRRLFPCDMLLARNASTAAAQARMPAAVYENDEPTASPKDGPQPFATVADKLHPNTLQAIKHTHMSVVQSRIFPLLPHLAEPHDSAEVDSKRPRDLLVKAKTGTGKTMAFLVPAIEARVKAIDAHVARAHTDSGLGSKWSKADALRAATAYASDTVGTLILSPTRELATQIAVEAANLTVHHRGFQVQVLLGGEHKGRQISSWERGRKDIVVATPGRMMDLLDSVPMFAQALAHTKILVLDEADTLLDMGFKPDIEKISSFLPASPKRQTFLFSATVSKEIQGIARTLLSPSHTFVNCVSESDVATHTHIPQYTTVLPGAGGAEALPHILRLLVHDQLICAREGRKSKVIIFLSTTKMTQLVASLLSEATTANPAAFPMRTRTYEMHAKREMSTRVRVSNAFRGDVAPGSAAVLITSDVSARGVDYPGVTRVIQLGVPPSPDMYVHRVGRTGRGGDRGGKGRADLVVCQWEADAVRRIESSVGVKSLQVETHDIERECLDMLKEGVASDIAAAAVPASSSSGRAGTRARPAEPYGPANLESLTSLCTALTTRLAQPPAAYPDAPASDEFGSTFLAQLGFYIGRAATTGLRTDRVATGLQAFFKELGGLARDLRISRNIQLMLSGGEGQQSRGGGGSSRYGSGGGGSWDRNSRSRGIGGFGYPSQTPSYGAGRGDPQREGYRKREGGAFGYTPAAMGHRTSAWEGATGRSANQYTRDRDNDSSSYGRDNTSRRAPARDRNFNRNPARNNNQRGRTTTTSEYTPSYGNAEARYPGGYARSGERSGGRSSSQSRYSRDEDAY